jgi:predicted HTH domain antitoxin
MNITIEVPEDVAHQLESIWGDLPQRAVEALAIEAYRSGVITEAEVQRMLHLSSRWEVDAFLKRAKAYLDYTETDLEQDILAIRQVLPQ